MLAPPAVDLAISNESASENIDLTASADEVFTMEEAARRKGVSYHTVSRAVRSGKLRAKRLGRMALIDGDELRRWSPMRQRAPKRYRKPPDLDAVPGVVDLASGERIELARRLAVFSQTIHVAAAERDQTAFHQLLCDRFSQALGLRRVVLWTVDEERSIATRVASFGPPLSEAPGIVTPIPTEVLDHVKANPGVHVERGVGDRFSALSYGFLHVRMILVAPLRVGDRWLGAFWGDWDGEEHELSEDELSLTQILANQAALAIDLARLRAAESERVKQLRAILDNLSEAVSATDGNHRMLYMNRASREITGYEYPETTLNRPVLEVASMVKRFELDGSELRPEETPLAVALKGERVRDRRYYIEHPGGVRVAVSVNAEPIRDEETIIGAVAVTRDITTNMQREVADQDYRRNLESAVGRARAVGDISLAVNSGDDLQSVLQTAISTMTDLLGGVSGSIYFHRSEGDQLGGQMVGQVGYKLGGTPVQDSPRALMDLPATIRALAKRTAILHTYAKASTSERLVFDRYGFRSALIVPLMVGAEPIGAAYVNYLDDDHNVDDGDLAFAGALAAQCALAIEKARLHDELASAHQRLVSVLDQLPYGIILAEAPDGFITFANSVAQSLVGNLDSNEYRTVNDLPLISVKPGLFGTIDRQIEATLRSGKRIQGQSVRIVQPNKEEIPAVAHVNVLSDSVDRQIGVICVLEAGPDARQTEKLTGEIATAIAHELRNPLTALIGNIQLLRRRIDQMEQPDLEYISDRIDRIEGISKQLGSVLKARE
jgi:PAS domain S-box-containing protein/excisionase family DNA binding protein